MAILDSGTRREFESGAVRDCAEGRGRCDLLPLDVAAELLAYYSDFQGMTASVDVLKFVSNFLVAGSYIDLYQALYAFCNRNSWGVPEMLLEVSKHFEEGANKYGERNWEKGIPAHCYVDSAVRHYLKWCEDIIDERHDRAFCWNILCLVWTLKHHPECNDLPGVSADGNGG